MKICVITKANCHENTTVAQAARSAKTTTLAINQRAAFACFSSLGSSGLIFSTLSTLAN
jgi:hypothetical protein